MEIDYLDLQKLIDLVNYAAKKGKEPHREFYMTVKDSLQPFAVMLPLLKFAKRSTLTLPNSLAMDLNSLVREYGEVRLEVLMWGGEQ